ncbi:MAG: LPS-assembly protein LptD [Bacteroidetes bacterium]|nr:LPS-assembly protein LptD [Bacteroidota bacterium]
MLKTGTSVFFTIAMLISIVFVLFLSEASFAQDSISKPSPNSGIKSKVVYNSRDSVRFDVKNQKVFLFGDADVKYEDMELHADYIEFDMADNIAFARGGRDSAGKAIADSAGMPVGDPVFSDGEKSFDAKEITYNFETKKGKIREVTTQEGEAFIHAKDAKKDTGDVYYIKNGRYTTCDLVDPHFYIKSTKLKIIPDDKIISGPAYLVIADMPTPLALPFGVFPNKTGRKSGILIPFYGESNLGYFLKEGGYYFGISDYFDLALRGDFYSKGSYGVKAHTNYERRYKYSGNLGISFSDIQISEKEFPDYRNTQDFFVKWQHAQDAKKNPTSRFSANVNAGSSTYQTFNSNTANEYLTNTFQSNIAWNKSWQGKPYALSMNMSHSQNTLQKTVDVTLPEAAFSVARQYPFKRKEQIGKPNVLEKIGTSFSLNARNQISSPEKDLFKESSLQKFRNGLRATVPISTSQNLGPLIFTPSVNLSGRGYFQTIRKHFDVSDSSLVTDTLHRFAGVYDWNAALAMSTKLYGMYLFKRGRVKAIRHVITPNASLSYRPDFSQEQYNYYHYVQTSIAGDSVLYSIFQNGIYESPDQGKSGFVNFSLNNNLEMKVRPSKKDTSTQDKKIMLIENLSIASSYNLAAEHYNWSDINVTGSTRLFKIVNITLSGILDPYAYDSTLNRRVERFEFRETGNMARLTSAAFSLSTSLRSLMKKNTEDKNKKTNTKGIKQNEDELNYIMSHPDYYVDFSVPWNLSFNYNVIYTKPDTLKTITQSFTFNGDLSVTEKWKIGFQSGFDIVKKDFTFTSLNIYRDMHCWEMHFDWVPFGLRKSYMLSVAVKASVLQDLKLSRKREWYDYN